MAAGSVKLRSLSSSMIENVGLSTWTF